MDIKTIPDSFIDETWAVMAACSQHTFLILTKRPRRMIEAVSNIIPKYGTLPNVWLGLTIVNQQEADEKIPIFLQVPGKKFLSLEPMLGEIILERLGRHWLGPASQSRGMCEGIEAVILGGETGPGARPMDLKWVRSIRDQCQNAGVPFFLKSLGEKVIGDGGTANNPLIFKAYRSRLLDGRTHDDLPWVKNNG
jgi:protein gp37